MSETEPKSTKLNIVLDRTEEIKSKDEKIESLNKELGTKDEIIKSYMKNDVDEQRRKIEHPVQPPTTGETAHLYEEPKQKIDFDGSEIPSEWLKANSVPELLNAIEKLSHVAENKEEYKQIMSRLTKKVIRGKIDMEFHGSSKDFMRTAKIINENDSDEIKSRKEIFNARLRANRQNWKNLE
jgi:hypothetical protein